ncbi:TlpA family protein disulfide reductase [Candidatus Sumerlaeota bacterium]|nr:TlpA family protein disulfide reductase [Candidatus Sumerlaeota bacterium]MBI3736932.1 TlpA family protein disulfide reductase [Candidatus Sumerlaeota bacterium]
MGREGIHIPRWKGRRVRIALLGIAFLLVVFFLRAAATVKDNKLKFSFPDLEGKTVTESDERFKGKVVFVDIWGSWCSTCLGTLPELDRIYGKYREKGLEVIGIAFEKNGTTDEQLAKLKKFAQEHKIKYPVLFGGSVAATRFKLKSVEGFHYYPTGIVIGRDGLVRHVYDGFNADMMGEIEDRLGKLINEKQETPKK